MDLKDSITLGEGRGNAFIGFLKEGREGKEIALMLKTPEKSGNFRGNYTRRPSMIGESLWEKVIGKPDSGKLNVRFDEGELQIGH